MLVQRIARVAVVVVTLGLLGWIAVSLDQIASSLVHLEQLEFMTRLPKTS